MTPFRASRTRQKSKTLTDTTFDLESTVEGARRQLEPRKPRLLIYDLEVSPNLTWTYNSYDAIVVKTEMYQKLMSFSYCWYEEGKKPKIIHRQLPDTDTYNVDHQSDKLLVKELWELINQADVYIAHNNNGFDAKMSNTLFLRNGLLPPNIPKSIDTLRIARSKFKFTGNSLDALCHQLGVEGKSQTKHGDVWYDCFVNKDLKSWKAMRVYNDQDVKALIDIYLLFRPYISNHPNLSNISNIAESCPVCGSDEGFKSDGIRTTQSMKYRRLNCRHCGAPVHQNLGLPYEKPIYKS